MIAYQFPNGSTIDVESLAAVDEISWVDASINKHSDFTYGEFYYELIFKFTENRMRRYFKHTDKDKLETERKDLIGFWQYGIKK